MQRQQSLVEAITFGNVKTTPDMRGEIDHQTHIAVSKLASTYGLKLTKNYSGQNNDVDYVVLRDDAPCGFLEVERSLSFYNGVYHSPKYNAVSIPARKIPTLQLPGTDWLCFSRELTHFIVLGGRYILENSSLESYYTRKQSIVKETFLMLPRHLAVVQQFPRLLLN